MRMAEGLAEEGAFSANLTHFWHFSTLMKIFFIPYSEEKSKRFIAIRRTSLLVKKSAWEQVFILHFYHRADKNTGKIIIQKRKNWKEKPLSTYSFYKTDVPFL